MTKAPCPDYTPEPVGLHPWVERICQYWGRAGCIIDGRTCEWEGKPNREENLGAFLRHSAFLLAAFCT